MFSDKQLNLSIHDSAFHTKEAPATLETLNRSVRLIRAEHKISTTGASFRLRHDPR
jgi:hypothetical protein